jgi:hypothetical protein
VGIQVEIVSILQEVDLNTLGMSNHLVLLLPNKEKIKVPVSDEDAQRILSARTGGEFQPAAPAPPVAEDPIPATELKLNTSEDEEASFEFGGGGTQPEPKTETPAPTPRRKLQVTKNEYGYPVVQGMPGKDPGEIVGGGTNQDEDGVGSI